MDMIVYWGVFKHLRKEVNATGVILISALVLDLIVLTAFLWIKASSDIFVVILSAIGIVLVFAGEKWFCTGKPVNRDRGMYE
jgi:heme/copper-type cytochrome/quinol oxidase subunit 4